MIGSATNPGRFIGYSTLPYQDWVNRQLLNYVSQRNQYGEGGYADPWMTQLMSNGSPLGSADSLNQAVQGIGGYGAIGFDPNSIWNQRASEYAQTGYGLSRDASGNVVEPMFNYDATGHFGPLSVGGSEGENIAELGKVLAAAAGGMAAGGAGAGPSSTAGFGEAGYAGAAGGGAAAGAASSGAGYDFGMTGNEGSGLTASNGQPVAGLGGSGGGSLDSTGAFDQTASQGVFDSSGNPLYGKQEPGMWDWLDNLDNGDSFDLGNFGVDENSSSASTMSNASEDTGAFDQFGSNVGPDSNQTVFGGTSDNPFGDTSFLDNLTLKDIYNYGKEGYGYLKGLVGGGSGSSTTGGGILGNILGDPLGAAFNATPFLLALNEANKQSKDLNGVLDSVNADSYRRAVLDPYDLETGQNRYALQNDLGLRGVAGSSFGNQAIGNYDYTRALGRGDLASKAAVATAGLQGNLINQRNTNRNLLLGAGLNASGKLFSPPQDPFNLRALLGVA